MTRPRTLSVVVAVTAATAVFAYVQGTGAPGGAIGLPKALWLNLTILSFVALPALACTDTRFPASIRACLAAVAVSFAARGAVEVPILYLTDVWHCDYGIAHDVGTAAVVGWLWLRARRQVGSAAAAAQGLIGITIALCLVEAGFARAFCAVADPTATWFASAEPRFAAINAATWIVVGIAYPALAAVVWRMTGPGPAGSSDRPSSSASHADRSPPTAPNSAMHRSPP